VNDFKLCRATIESIPIERPAPSAGRPQGLCLDTGYDFPEVYELAAEFGFTAHIRSRREEAQALKREAGFRARRWVVERQSWLNRFRRILVRWEKRADTYLAMLHLASRPTGRRSASFLPWQTHRIEIPEYYCPRCGEPFSY
jgi:putative transposase